MVGKSYFIFNEKGASGILLCFSYSSLCFAGLDIDFFKCALQGLMQLISLICVNVVLCCSEDLARIYVAEIISAVSYLHENGIIHGDLKSHNILLDSEGHVSGWCV